MKQQRFAPSLGFLLVLMGLEVSAQVPADLDSRQESPRVFPVVPSLSTIHETVRRTPVPTTAATRLEVRSSAAASAQAARLNRQKREPEGEWVGTTSIHPALLTRPSEKEIDSNRPAMGFGLPRQLAKLALEIEGTDYELFYVDEKADQEYQFRHVTMAVLNHPESYARFTVDDRTGLVYGSLYTPKVAYRIVPNPGKPEQFIYRLSSRSITAGNSGAAGHGVADINQIARRHRQVEAVAAIAPDDVSGAIHAIWLSGGNLGRMRAASAKEFGAAIRRLSAVTQATGNERFRILSVSRSQNGQTHMELEQLLDGTPVASTNLVRLDSDRNIREIIVSLVPASVQPIKPNISEQEAFHKVVAQWEYEYGRGAASTQFTIPSRMYYSTEDAWRTYELVYEFRFQVNDERIEYHAKVNAVTGEVFLQDLTKYADFGHTICTDTSGRVRPPPPGVPQYCGQYTSILYSVPPGAISGAACAPGSTSPTCTLDDGCARDPDRSGYQGEQCFQGQPKSDPVVLHAGPQCEPQSSCDRAIAS